MNFRSLGLEYPGEKEMATHSSILAWKIPWTEEPGGTEADTTEVTYSTMILEILFLVIDDYKYSAFVFYHTSLDISLVYLTVTN